MGRLVEKNRQRGLDKNLKDELTFERDFDQESAMRAVNQIMNHDPLFCTADTRLSQIKFLLKKYDAKEILVMDSPVAKHPVGLVGMGDVEKPCIEHLAFASNISAIECMRSLPAVVFENSSLEECLTVMRKNHMSLIPVVDSNGHVRGTVDRLELSKLLMSPK